MNDILKITKEVLSQNFLWKLHKFTQNNKQPSFVNYFYYPENVVGSSNAIFQFDLDENLKNELAKELIEKNLILFKPKTWKTHINIFSRGSFIPWHDDGSYKKTITIYLNEQWDLNWGGAFLYSKMDFSKNNINCIYPEYNTAISFAPPLLHTTTLTTNNSLMRKSLQIFINEF